MDLVAHAAVIGRMNVLAGTWLVDAHSRKAICHSLPKFFEVKQTGHKVDIQDCTLFTVKHSALRDLTFKSPADADEILEITIEAISELIIWTKTKDIIGNQSSFSRRIGRLDVKYFLIELPDGRVVDWMNPLFIFDRDAAAIMASSLSGIVAQNGPNADPVHGVVKRVMSSLDLINLGFYTESFVNLFALVDDMVQEVLMAGISKKGFSEKRQKRLLRAIEDNRFAMYLTDLAKLCDWEDYQEVAQQDFDALMKANTKRNAIVHGSKRLNRKEVVEHCNALLKTLTWLSRNPFGYVIPSLPLLKLAETQFGISPNKDSPS